jgi:CRP-like cAMP-binding protein
MPHHRKNAGELSHNTQNLAETNMTDEAVQVLARLFPALSPETLDDLYHAARLVEYPAQVTLCREGEYEDTFYIVVSGRVDVYKLLEGQMLLINYLTSGAHFGDIALLLDLPRTATIITAEPTVVFEIDQDIFADFIKTNAEIVVALSQLMIKRFLAQEEKQLIEIARLKKRDVPPAKVFLSYGSVDRPFATRLANDLIRQRIDIWLDIYRIEPGMSWARQIGEALDTCQILLLVLSPYSVTSENVEDEWNYYLDQKKPVVTVLYEPCKIPYRLSKLQYISFHESDYELALARVVATLNTQL